jgi:hypothetical protein
MTHISVETSSFASCTLDVLYGGPGISNLQFVKKKIYFISAVIFSQFLVIKTLDMDPDLDPQ